jgi:sterol desaturase/sphingolipid hydroxylase (fatty acid hydroxylase superfamily)
MSAKLPYPTPTGHALEVLSHEVVGVAQSAFFLACGTFLLWPMWEKWVAFANVPDKVMFVAMTCLIHTGLYVAGWFVFCYLGDMRGWFAKYKLPRTKRMIPSPELVRTCVRDALINQVFKTPILLYLGVNFIPVSPQSTSCPSLVTLFLYFTGSLLWNSWGFYIAHRTLHEFPYLYQNIHKKHHNFVGTVSIAAEHAHPLEDLLANSIPTIGFAVAFQVPQPVWFVWLAARLIETYHGHSGYMDSRILKSIGLCGNSRHHDFHHTVNQGNYGGPMQDYFLGTMGPYMHQNGGKIY